MPTSAPIGILDSGLGGLSVLKEIRAILPDESLLYVGDSAWCPYGPRPVKEIQQRVFRITDYLLSRNAKMIVVACNSATIAAVEALRAAYPVPFTGMEPAVKPAAALTKTGVIGVLATQASSAGEKYHKLVNQYASSVRIITRPAPEFVELVESGYLTGPEVEATVEAHVRPLLDENADVLVLGCTHYPFLRPVIEKVAGPGVHIIDTGAAVARQVQRLLPLTSDGREIEVCTTGDLSTLQRLFPVLCPGDENVTLSVCNLL